MNRQPPKKRELWERYCPLEKKSILVEVLEVTEPGECPYRDALSNLHCTRADTGEPLIAVSAKLDPIKKEAADIGVAKLFHKFDTRTLKDVEEYVEFLASCDRPSWLVPSQPEPFVIYMPDGCGPLWALPLSSFMEEDPSSPNGCKFWRIADNWLELHRDDWIKKENRI